MAMFKAKQHIQKTSEQKFTRLYQYSSGEYLPDTSQPNPGKNYEITTGVYTPHEGTRYVNVVIGSNNLPQSRGADTTKPLPELYTKREDCCGCTACYAICPVHAITMRPDEEGFLYPVVDSSVCIRCYQCVKVCPVKRKDSSDS